MPAPLFDDVITEILGFLHNDHQTLKACTLTSRSWYLLSREFLHTKLCVDSRCETRLEFYKNRPDLSGLIQNLVIVLSVEGLCSKLENMHFPKLSTLYLNGSNGYGYNDNTLSGSLLDYFMKKPTLKRLYIKDTKLPIDRLVPFISSFPRLTSISLHCVSNAKETTDKHLDTCAQTKPVSAMKSLRHLRIDSSSGSLALVQFIQKLEVSPPIAYATLRIVPYRQWNRNIGDWFMHTVSSPTVKGIRLEERSRYTELQWTIEENYFVDKYDKLRCVEFVPYDNKILPWVTVFLSGINFDSLQRVVIFLPSIHKLIGNVVASEGCTALDQFLVGRKEILGDTFPEIYFPLSHSHRRVSSLASVFGVLREMLPLSTAAGMIHLEYV
ncbi:hypothetical protein QCA50_007178 [Cerrena zonata]|uniref:F-box domain-containing protein n=1 Tax=Cerrena zonata TaxID=2478898 RepID=A0AAW0GIU6_9APHY